MNTRQLFLPATLAVLATLAAAASAQTCPPAWNPATTYSKGQLVYDLNDGNIYKCIRTETTSHYDPRIGYGYWELYDVDSSVTLLVGPGHSFPSLKVAWAYVKDARIAQGMTITIDLKSDNGFYNESFPGSFSLNHTYGSQISIAGDSASSVQLNFTRASGFVINSGQKFGSLSGVTISGNNWNNVSGIDVYDGAHLFVHDVTIQAFATGLSAETEGSLVCDKGIQMNEFVTGVSASEHGTVHCNQPITLNGFNTALEGFFAETGGVIYAFQCSVSNVKYYGFYAYEGGAIHCGLATATGCQYGFYASSNGNIEAMGSTASSATIFGYRAEIRSYINGHQTSGTQSSDTTSFINN